MRSIQKISTKLLLAFAAVFALALALGCSSIQVVGGLGGALDTAVNRTAKKIKLAGELQAGFQEMRADATKLEISLVDTLIGRTGAESGGACGSCHTLDTIHSQQEEFAAEGARLTGQAMALYQMARDPAEKQAVRVVQSGIAEWTAHYSRYLGLFRQRDYEAAHEVMLTRIYPLVETMDKAARELAQQQQEMLISSSREAQTAISKNRMVALALIALCFVSGLGVERVVRGVNRLLRQFSADMAATSVRVTEAAHQLAASSEALALGASQQAASLEETSASTEQVHVTTRGNAGHCQNATAVTEQVNRHVERANQNLDQMIESMREINQSSGKISRIIRVIDEIAFQTNILALNAAVEAARAGQAGMGFAVVADEVRSLAQRCAQAAKDTESLIKESITRSREGGIQLDLVAEVVRAITESSAEVRGLIECVNTGSQEQTRGIEQISSALVQIGRVTQTAAQGAEENAAAGRDLCAQSECLRDVAAKLSALV